MSKSGSSSSSSSVEEVTTAMSATTTGGTGNVENVEPAVFNHQHYHQHAVLVPWGIVTQAIPRLLRGDSRNLHFDELYGNTVKIVLHKQAKQLYTETCVLVQQYLQTEMRPIVLHQMRESLLDFEFFEFLIRLWREFTHNLRMVAYVLLYLERGQFEPITVMGLRLFREEVLEFPEIKAHLELIGVEVDFGSIDLTRIDGPAQPFRYK